MIITGNATELFTDDICRHGAKAAIGQLLPVGNLWVEVAQGGLARARTPVHRGVDFENQLGVKYSNPDDLMGVGMADWYIMSHIAERGILNLAASLGPNMIDGMRLTPAVYVRSYSPIVDIIDMNPHLGIQGILSEGSWIYSSELAKVFPDQHVSELNAVAGTVVELGPAEEIGLSIQAVFATLNPEREAAFGSGEYRASVAGRFIDRQGMVGILKKFGIEKSALV